MRQVGELSEFHLLRTGRSAEAMSASEERPHSAQWLLWARPGPSRVRISGRKENGSTGTNRPKKLPFVPPLPLTAPDPGQTLDGPAAHPDNGHPVMTAVGRSAPMAGVVDISPLSISAGVASLRSVVPASSARKTSDRFNQKINEQAHTQRKLTSKRVQDVNRLREHRYPR